MIEYCTWCWTVIVIILHVILRKVHMMMLSGNTFTCRPAISSLWRHGSCRWTGTRFLLLGTNRRRRDDVITLLVSTSRSLSWTRSGRPYGDVHCIYYTTTTANNNNNNNNINNNNIMEGEQGASLSSRLLHGRRQVDVVLTCGVLTWREVEKSPQCAVGFGHVSESGE